MLSLVYNADHKQYHGLENPPDMLTIFFDVETTGLTKHPFVDDKYQPEIIEFYGCLYNLKTHTKVTEFESLIRPRDLDALPDKITKITGIGREMLANQPSFIDVADSIDALIADANELCGHNVVFDVGMTDLEFARLQRPTPRWPPRWRWLCTIEQTMGLKGYRMTFSALYEHLFGETHSAAHRARGDVEAHIRVVEEMIKREML